MHYCALSVKIGVNNDERSPWFFKGLSASSASQVLRTISVHSEEPYEADLDEESLKEETVPYDDMPFKVEATGEELPFWSTRLRAFAPGFVRASSDRRAYRCTSPTFRTLGPSSAYKCSEFHTEDEFGEFTIVRRMRSIESSIARVMDTLRGLNFGA